jgi:chromosome segregation ATPase
MLGQEHLSSILIYGGATGLSGAGGVYFLRWLMTFVAGRYDKREAHLDDATQRLFDRMEKQITGLTHRVERAEQELKHCHEQHAEARAEVMELRAMMQGYGDARQAAALIVAADKKEARG